jgi:F-type H+-transporting ATPase subunit delta
VKNLAVARRYAKALILIGKEDGQAESYRNELEGVSDLFEKEKALGLAVTNPLYVAANRRNVLETIIEKLNLSHVMSSFLMLLFDKGRIGFLKDINTYYQALADELKGVARAELISAADLSSDAVDKIRTALSNMIQKDIVLEFKQDPNLIGGIVTRIGDLVLDGSIKTQLLNMKESLKRGERV